MAAAFTLHVTSVQGLENLPYTLWRRIGPKVLDAGGAKLKWLTLQNFGSSGRDRPSAWPSLSKRYANRVGRTFPTLDKSGRLFRSFRLSRSRTFITLHTQDVPYASVHQFGYHHMPLRPYFPVNPDGSLTPHAKREVIKAMVDVIRANYSPSGS